MPPRSPVFPPARPGAPTPASGPGTRGLAAALAGALLLTGAPPARAEAPEPVAPAAQPREDAILQRVQVLYDPATGEIVRRPVKVREAFPGEGLQFTWEPAQGPGLDADGFASGPGRLLWRIPGTAAYDPRALAARYEGTLRAGAPEGEGRLGLRDGSWREGRWRAGLQEGPGRWSRADGSLYVGDFVAGQPEGAGALSAAAGWIYTGPFRAGQPEGAGRLRMPSGEERAVTMRAGVEVVPPGAAERLLQVQGGDAARVQISVVTNARVALQQSLSYTHHNSGEALQIYPQDDLGNSQGLLGLWSGSGTLDLPYPVTELTPDDWLATRAFLDITLETGDGGKVRVDELRLVSDRSSPWLRPMLENTSEDGCVGSRPWFELVNAGWGAVEAPRLRARFATPSQSYSGEVPDSFTDWFVVPVEGFDAGQTVDLRATLRTAGVDLATLEGSRFTCPDREQIETCAANLLMGLPLGALDDAVEVSTYDGRLQTVLHGELSYQWRDADGAMQQAVETFVQPVTLAVIEIPSTGAEMGSGGAFATPAPEFQEIELPVEGQDLQLALDLRGNPNLARAEAHVQLFAQRSSIHLLRVEAQLGDGSVASSMPLQLFYLSLRDTSGWQSKERPGGCFLPTDF